MSKEALNEYFDVCISLTKECGKVIKVAHMKDKKIHAKSCATDVVTETDEQVEKLLIGGLKKKFPTHLFIGEESTEATGKKCVLTNDPTWIIDPVDGTMNFVHSLPQVAISIALLINKSTVLGIIYNPILDQLYTAKVGQGAFLNGTQIHVSGQQDLAKALVCTEVCASKDPENDKILMGNATRLVANAHGVRSYGSAACAFGMVAAGSADAFCHIGFHVWDFAAGDLIVREAGGYLCGYDGGPLDLMNRRAIGASSEALAKQIASILQEFPLERD